MKMSENNSNQFDIFKHGSAWLRADFHLHTKADQEFVYTGGEDRYCKDYVEALEKAEIGVGVIANHNKFDAQEFKALRKTAWKKGIFLLPGVELSVSEGRNCVHTIIVFSDEWLGSRDNYDSINPFLTATFGGRPPDQYENENARSSENLIDTIKRLEGLHKDFFLVFAHVEKKRGFWDELDGGPIIGFGKDEYFRRRALAFQQVKTHDLRIKVKDWLGNAYPAEVEGSDPKAIDQIGRKAPGYIKIGDFTFEAVKYALLDHQSRVATSPQQHENSHILSASFIGGALDGQTINFSPELNTLIGIRGSGKSSILEAVRYALDIPFGEKTVDQEYKTNLVRHILGSGGKVIVQAIDRREQRYEIRRILNEQPNVYIDGILQPGVSIRETILHKPIYFGQKDLSSTGDGFEKDLVEKLVGVKLADIRVKIGEQKERVVESVDRLKKSSNTEEQKKEYEAKIQDAKYRLEFFQKHGVEEKLKKQVGFDADSRKCKQTVTLSNDYLVDFESFIDKYEDELINHRIYKSEQNAPFFNDFFTTYDKLVASFQEIKKAFISGKKTLAELKKKAANFENRKEGFREEFAEIERKLADEMKDAGVKAIYADEFRRLQKIVSQARQMLDALGKQESRHAAFSRDLLKELDALNDLWHEEFNFIKGELEVVNSNQSSLHIKPEYKGDKSAFIEYMKVLFQGSNIRMRSYKSLAEKFSDFGALYRGLHEAKNECGSLAAVFEKYFMNNLSALLTWQVPNRFTIEYRGKQLKHHSLGQRASALILFVLSQRVNDVIIIDQPEDDLDNQTIYEDVIKLIRTLKPDTQFIFATHNANFPVLGDSEQVISCSYSDDSISVTTGGIDRPEIQQEIVSIMEGGEEAFTRRKRIYEIWKSRNS